MARLLFSTPGLPYSEPSMLLQQELREPAPYNSVLFAVAHGMTSPKGIAERAGIERVSMERLARRSAAGELPSLATSFGK